MAEKSVLDLAAEFTANIGQAQLAAARERKSQAPYAARTFREGRELKSDAAAVVPSRIPEAEKMLREAGCPTRYDAEGRPCFRSLRHRSLFCRVTGLTEK